MKQRSHEELLRQVGYLLASGAAAPMPTRATPSAGFEEALRSGAASELQQPFSEEVLERIVDRVAGVVRAEPANEETVGPGRRGHRRRWLSRGTRPWLAAAAIAASVLPLGLWYRSSLVPARDEAASEGPRLSEGFAASGASPIGGVESRELRAVWEADQSAINAVLERDCHYERAACERLSHGLAGNRNHLGLGWSIQRALAELGAFEARGGAGGPAREVFAELPMMASLVARLHEYYTKNAVGRGELRAMLRRCGAYTDVLGDIERAHGLGVQLAALALTESACVADAEAPNGARGLLQLMPATARAYGLVVNGAVDERLDVDASTRAAARYLSDLHHTFGSWEVALVGYTDGPVMVAKRLAGVGAEKPFNDAAWSGAYSEYSVRYVARVRAYELILKNGKQLEALDDVPAEDVAAP